MIVFLLLVIIAILLLGASRFLGIVGTILGTLIAVVAAGVGLGSLASAFDMDAADLLMYVLLGCIPLVFVVAVASSAQASSTRKGAAPPKLIPGAPLSREEKRAARRKLRGLE